MFRAQLEELQKRWLLTTQSNRGSNISDEPHRRALLAVEKTERATRTLEESMKMAAETEELGIESN